MAAGITAAPSQRARIVSIQVEPAKVILTGKELQYADDFHLRPNPVMFFQVPGGSEYIIEMKDVIYRGRGDFILPADRGISAVRQHHLSAGRAARIGSSRGTELPWPATTSCA